MRSHLNTASQVIVGQAFSLRTRFQRVLFGQLHRFGHRSSSLWAPAFVRSRARKQAVYSLRISAAGIWLFCALSGSAQTVSASPAQVSQAVPSGGPAVSVNVTLTASAGTVAVTLAAATDSGGNWLSVTPGNGIAGSGTPLAISVAMDPSGLPDGTYTGNVTASPPAPSPSIQVPVVMLLGNPGPQLSPVGPVNGASFQGAVAPGDVVTFQGSAIGPKLPYGIQIQDGAVQPKIAGTRIWFGINPAPLIYAYPNEVAAVVPAGVTGTVQIRAENMVARSLPLNLVVASPPSGNGPPAAVSASAIATAGNSPFNFTFADPRGWQDLDVVNILINNFLDGRSACYLAYSRPLNVLYLVNDAGTALLPGLTLNGSGSVTNSQCMVTGAGSSTVGLGASLTLSLNMSFGAGFAGNKVTYLAARDLEGGNSGWQALGTRSMPDAVTFPSVVAVSPVRGAGSSQAFTFTFSDTKGYQDLGILDILINNFLDGRQACYLAYSQPSNVLYLVKDSGSGLLPGLPLNGSGTTGNSQCTVSAAGSSATGSGTTLILTLNIAFTPAFAGNRVVYAAARDSADANNSGWQSMAAWTSR